MKKNYFEDILEQKVMVNGTEFTFSNRIGTNQVRVDSFNELFSKTFGLSFESVGGDYEPHVLLQGDKVCANVSVNQMPMIYQGKRCFCIQLGSVMTDENYRKMGLGRYLLEQICKRWQEHCDMIFLFANDSVLEYYPKFGFQKKTEYEYSMAMGELCSTEAESMNGEKSIHAKVEKLDMKDKANVELVNEFYQKKAPFSLLSMIDNKDIHEFYYESIFADFVWYDKEKDLVYCVEEDENTIVVYDILGETSMSLSEVTARIAGNFEHVGQIRFEFTPINTTGMDVKLHKEEDTTLFVRGKMGTIFDENQMMFPENIHA